MADPLSMVAGIVGISAAGVQLANTVYRMCDKFAHAPHEMRLIAAGMIHLSTILEDLNGVLEDGQRKSVYKPRLLTDTQGVLQRFKKVQTDVEKLIKKHEGFRGRVGWVFNSSKVTGMLVEVECLKSGMNLILWTVHFAIEKKSPENKFGKRTRFRNLVETIVRENRQKILTIRSDHPVLLSRRFPPIAAKPERLGSKSCPEKTQIAPQGLFAVGADIRESERTEDTQSLQQEIREGNNGELSQEMDPAIWLYSLTFALEAEPDDSSATATGKEVDEKLGEQCHSSTALLQHMAIEDLHEVEVPSAVSNLLSRWTFFSREEMAAIAFEMRDKEAIDEALALPKNAEDRPSEYPGNISHDETKTVHFGLKKNHTSHHSIDPMQQQGRKQQLLRENLPQSVTMEDEDEEEVEEISLPEQPPGRPPTLPHYIPTFKHKRPISPPDFTLNRDREVRERDQLKQRLADAERELEWNKHEEKIRREKDTHLYTQRIPKRLEFQDSEHRSKSSIVNHDQTQRLDTHVTPEERIVWLLKSEMDSLKRQQQANDTRAEITKFNTERERTRNEEERAERQIKLEAELESMKQQISTRQIEDDHKRLIKAHEASVVKAKEDCRIQKQEIIAEYEMERQAKEDEKKRLQAEIIAMHESQIVTTGSLEGLQDKIVYESSEQLLKNSRSLHTRTFQSPTSEGYFLLSTTSDARLAYKELKLVQLQHQLNHDISENQRNVDHSDSTSTHGSTEESDTGSAVQSQDSEYQVLFPTNYNGCRPQFQALAASLAKHRMDPFFETINSRGRNSSFMSLPNFSSSLQAKSNMIKGTLLWEPSTIPGGSELFESLWESGWRPVYMRGSKEGQTWFYGSQPIHVRFIRPEYLPQIEDLMSQITDSYLIIGYECIEADALQLAGFTHQILPSGFCVLESDVSYDDILSLIATSFLLREAALRRKAKKGMVSFQWPPSAEQSIEVRLKTPTPEMETITGVPKLLETIQ